MTNIKTAGRRPGEFLLSEGPGNISREVVTLAASAVDLPAGQVLGQITLDGTAAAAARAGNTGNGVMGAITVSAGAKPGVYILLFTEPAADVGNFIVHDPDGKIVGQGDVAAEFSGGGLTFSLADGATDFVAGDGFDITVAAGSGHYAPYDSDALDGTDAAKCILYAPMAASDTAQDRLVIQRLAVVTGTLLTGLDTAAKADLAAYNIIVR